MVQGDYVVETENRRHPHWSVFSFLDSAFVSVVDLNDLSLEAFLYALPSEVLTQTSFCSENINMKIKKWECISTGVITLDKHIIFRCLPVPDPDRNTK